MSRSIRDISLATLLVFSSGCIFQCGSYQSTAPYQGNHSSNNRPKPAARPPQSKPKPAKPAQPRPAQPRPKPKPKPEPKPEQKPPPRPDRPSSDIPKTTQIVVPIRVGFDESVDRVDAMIQKTMTQDWQTVSKSGAAIKVEVRYTVWRDPLKASFDNGTLKVNARVRYAADVRASAKNPVGSGRIWLTKGLTWGTKSDPQTVDAKFHAKFNIEDNFSVTAAAALDDIDHGRAPSGNICLKGLVKICISKEQIAPMVHKNLERQIVPKIQKALDDADKQFEKALRLKKQADTLWTALQQPQQLQKPGQGDCPSEAGALCTKSAWLVAKPKSIGVSQPRMDGKDLRVDIGIGGDFAVQLGDKPKVNVTPLPPLKRVTEPPGFAVHAHLRIPLATLSAEINRYLRGQNVGEKGTPEIQVTRVSVIDSYDPRHPSRIRLGVGIRGGLTADLEVQGDLSWDTKKGELSIKNLGYTLDTDNEALKRLSAANHAALLKMLADKAHWKIGSKTASLGKAITQSLGNVWRGHLGVTGELSKLQLEKYSMEKGALAADVLIAGQLGVTFTP